MVSVVAENSDVARTLGRLVVLSQEAGAKFSDDLVVRCRDGYLSIEAPPAKAGEVLIDLPWDTLVPLQPFRLAIAGDKFVISSHDPGLTSACVECMEAMLELYNLTDKLAAHRRTSPWSLIGSYPELLRHISGAEGGDTAGSRQSPMTPRATDRTELDSFFQSRTFGYVDSKVAPRFPVLMPILDAMNHHFAGAPFLYQKQGDNLSLLIMRSVPLPGRESECFAFYGPHDCFETWMAYGFIDQSGHFVRSVAMTIDLPGLGTIRTTNSITHRDRKDLPPSMTDVHFYVPKLLARRQNQLGIAALLIPGPRAPRALRRTLRLLITEMSPAHSKLHHLVIRAEGQVIAANRAYYRNLAAVLRAMTLDDPRLQPIRDNFLRVCDLQMAHLDDYAVYARS